MKKILRITFIFMVLIPQAIFSQWNFSHHFTEDDFNAIDFLTPDYGYLGGKNFIARTTNGGDDWLTLSDFGPTVNALSFLDINTGVAGGEWYYDGPGFIFYTTDGGFHWDDVYFSFNIGAVQDIFLLDTDHGWAVADYGGIYKSNEYFGLGDWNLVYEAQTDLNAVHFINENTGWAVGWGELLKTTDGGNNWQELETGINLKFFDVYFLNENKGWILANPNLLLSTTDGGTTWAIDTLNVQLVNRVYFYNDNDGIIVCNGMLLRTSDGGATWSEHSISSGRFVGLSVIGDSTISTCGIFSKLFKSTDLGDSWSSMDLDEFNDLYSVNMISANTGVAVGAEGTIIKRSGSGWVSGLKTSAHNLNSVFALNENTAVTVGDSGTILKSYDNYLNWVPISSGTVSDLYSVQFVDNTGWIAGENGTILKSADAGESWTLLTGGVSERLTSLSFVDNETGWAAGDGGVIIKTTDGGGSWSAQNSGTNLNLLKIEFKNSNTGFALGESTNFFRTDDGGTTWNLIYSDAYSKYNATYDFSFYSTTRGWMCGGWGNIFRTTDGGYTWRQQFNSASIGFHCIDAVDSNNVYLAADDGVILFTTIGGGEPGPTPVELISFQASVQKNNVTLSWSTATETNNHGFEVQRESKNDNWVTIGFVEGNGTTVNPHQYSFTDRNMLPGSYSYRLKQADFNGSSTISDAVNIEVAPPAFSLSQNYPNPFNPSTDIGYQVPEAGFVTLKVYNILGEEIAVLVNEHKTAGNYTVKFDAGNLTSGIYLYQLKADAVTLTRKLILLK